MNQKEMEGPIMEESKKRLYVEPDGFWTEAAILFMVLALLLGLNVFA